VRKGTPGRPDPRAPSAPRAHEGEGQAGSPALATFQSAKSLGLRLSDVPKLASPSAAAAELIACGASLPYVCPERLHAAWHPSPVQATTAAGLCGAPYTRRCPVACTPCIPHLLRTLLPEGQSTHHLLKAVLSLFKDSITCLLDSRIQQL
jgi:hypothetical protein